MPVVFDKQNAMFWLHGRESSYGIRLVNHMYLMHAYWGKKVPGLNTDVYKRYFQINEEDFSRQEMRLENLPQEYPAFGHGDLRSPALHVCQQDGSRVLDLKYRDYRIYAGKRALYGLPVSFGGENDCTTLEIALVDEKTDLDVVLSYTMFEDLDIIARDVRVENRSKESVTIQRMHTVGFDFDRSDFDMLTLSGAWSRERQMYIRPLTPGYQGVESIRGASSLIASATYNESTLF